MTWGPADEAKHPRDAQGQWAEKLSARLGQMTITALDLLPALELHGGTHEVYNPRTDAWEELAEVRRSDRAQDRIQMRGWGVMSRATSSTTVPLFTVYDTERVRLRPNQRRSRTGGE